jgi:hypothetical protein
MSLPQHRPVFVVVGRRPTALSQCRATALRLLPNKLLKLPAAPRVLLQRSPSRPWWATTGSLVATGRLVVS